MGFEYDSAHDTEAHIKRVREFLDEVRNELWIRGAIHDYSKLHEPEKSAFDRATPKLRNLTYGSPEYEEARRELGEALDRHYAVNSHHPEFYDDGITGMSLLDLIEMLCDWKAATERHADGDIRKSLEINAERFGIDRQLHLILMNTIDDLFPDEELDDA